MYNHKEIEQKWIKFWDENKVYQAKDDFTKPKFYTLVEFPYPSGSGLHVGHVKGQTAVDIYARYKRMNGYNVLNAMGWDAFGLPAENFAIKNKQHPRFFTQKNINTYRNQIKSFGPSFDWDREIDTTDPNYYKWTQWIFLQLFKKGLAYEKYAPINWCPSCKTGLANEEVINGKCERCETQVEQKPMKQWFLRITAYADRLIKDLDDLDWPEYIKINQKNWIGRSYGTEFKLEKYVEDDDKTADKPFITVYTTRIDTVFGMTYCVIAPDHPDVMKFITNSQMSLCLEYINQANKKSSMERTELNKDKTGVFTGSFVVNPFNGDKVPLWIADYVLGSYGTGAVMAVPAHDERDFEFAKKYGLEIKHVVKPVSDADFEDGCYTEYGVLENSGEFSGLTSPEAITKMQNWLEEKGIGSKKVNYKLRDWLFSRQRYRGEPIPLIHLNPKDVENLPVIQDISQAKQPNMAYILQRQPTDDDMPLHGSKPAIIKELVINGKVFSTIYDGFETKIVCDGNLPVVLPDVENYEPTGTGHSPLEAVTDWVNVRLADNLVGKRETNTMPQWAGSSWYFIRYIDPKNNLEIGSKEKLKYFMPVDIYFGGAEHTTVHLLYSRFWNKFLYDIGVVPTLEPYRRRVQHGLIMGEDGRKMSKRWGNVINPDDVINTYGADTMRVYIMFMGPYQDTASWSTSAINGIHKFIKKIYDLKDKIVDKDSPDTIRLLHKTIKKVSEDIEQVNYHTAIASLMIMLNHINDVGGISKESLKVYLKLLAPFAPFITEEIWHILGETNSIHQSNWPKYDENLVVDETVDLAVQFNGKTRGTIKVSKEIGQQQLLDMLQKDDKFQKYFTGSVKKIIFVPGRIINIII